ncbi:TetR/AcrR family transcriptional regulator [Dermacoccaceae bacterium W4C1]
MTTEKYHHGNLRAALVEAAERTIAAGGVDGLSLRGLARELGVSHAAPARHFADRRALLDAVAQQGFLRMQAQMVQAADQAGPSAPSRLAALTGAYLDFVATAPALVQLMFEHKVATGAAPELVRAGHEVMEVVVAEIVHGQQRGEVVDGDATALARTSFALVHGLAILAAGGLFEDNDIGQVAEQALGHLAGGIAAD